MKTFKIAVSCILIIALAAVCAFSIMNGTGDFSEAESISGKQIETTRQTPVLCSFTADEQYVRPVGRTVFQNGERWFSFSGSGIEFTCIGDYADITLLCEDPDSIYYRHEPRVAVFVNDNAVFDETVSESEKVVHVDLSAYDEEVTIRVIKLSESAFSAVGVGKISVNAKCDIKPTEEKPLKIEFIGDSITAGYGIDEEYRYGSFSTSTENFTKTYAYLAAKELDAQYSAVAYSGYGVLSGSTSSGYLNADDVIFNKYPAAIDEKTFAAQQEGETTSAEEESESEAVQENTSSSEESESTTSAAESEQLDPTAWNFKDYVPNLVVINLGANDETYCTTDERKEAFADEYVKLLELVREKYPEAYILCVLGDMNDTLYTYVEQAVQSFQNDGDSRISSALITFNMEENGSVIDGHPSAKANISAAKSLAEEISKVLYDNPYIYDEITDANGEVLSPSTNNYLASLETTQAQTDEYGETIAQQEESIY